MDLLRFKDTYDVAIFMLDAMAKNSYRGNVTAVLYYDRAKSLIKALLQTEDVEAGCINISPAFVSGYNKEYYVTLDQDLNLWVEPVFHGDEIIYEFSDVILYDGDAKQKIADQNDGTGVTSYEILFETPCEDDSSEEDPCEDCALDCMNCAVQG